MSWRLVARGGLALEEACVGVEGRKEGAETWAAAAAALNNASAHAGRVCVLSV